MGWAVMILLALATGFVLGCFLRRDKGALQFLAAALLLALAGYSWQGRPGLAGSPTRPGSAVRQAPDSDFMLLREDLLGRFDRAWTWSNLADGYRRRGDTEGAARVLAQAIRNNPGNTELWIAYGDALVAHSGRMMSPAAQLAFRRAAQLAPDHPAPLFFHANALLETGNVEEAERIWRAMLPGLPARSPYPPLIAQRLQAIDRARAAGQIPPA